MNKTKHKNKWQSFMYFVSEKDHRLLVFVTFPHPDPKKITAFPGTKKVGPICPSLSAWAQAWKVTIRWNQNRTVDHVLSLPASSECVLSTCNGYSWPSIIGGGFPNQLSWVESQSELWPLGNQRSFWPLLSLGLVAWMLAMLILGSLVRHKA